jgi:tRNA uridine 5-carbamoylmethylation protein Kti12
MGRKLILMQGLPGSGKTTWAGAYISEDPQHRFRLNRDALRRMAHGMFINTETEAQVINAELAVCETLLDYDITVVVDDTNLNPEVIAQFAYVAHRTQAQMTVVSFVHVPVAECLERNRRRLIEEGHGVPDNVIIEMYEKYPNAFKVATTSLGYDKPIYLRADISTSQQLSK